MPCLPVTSLGCLCPLVILACLCLAPRRQPRPSVPNPHLASMGRMRTILWPAASCFQSLGCTKLLFVALSQRDSFNRAKVAISTRPLDRGPEPAVNPIPGCEPSAVELRVRPFGRVPKIRRPLLRCAPSPPANLSEPGAVELHVRRALGPSSNKACRRLESHRGWIIVGPSEWIGCESECGSLATSDNGPT